MISIIKFSIQDDNKKLTWSRTRPENFKIAWNILMMSLYVFQILMCRKYWKKILSKNIKLIMAEMIYFFIKINNRNQTTKKTEKKYFNQK